jgi:hypothetical protein
MRVLDARGLEPERNYPFAVALQLFEPLLASSAPGAGARLLTVAAGLVGPLFSGEYAGTTTRSPFALLHGLFCLAVNASQSGSVLLCVDDAQWNDDLSLRFVRYLIHRIDPGRLGTV